MDELQAKLKMKLEGMRQAGLTKVDLDYRDIAKIYQLICMMKQMKEIIGWCE